MRRLLKLFEQLLREVVEISDWVSVAFWIDDHNNYIPIAGNLHHEYILKHLDELKNYFSKTEFLIYKQFKDRLLSFSFFNQQLKDLIDRLYGTMLYAEWIRIRGGKWSSTSATWIIEGKDLDKKCDILNDFMFDKILRYFTELRKDRILIEIWNLDVESWELHKIYNLKPIGKFTLQDFENSDFDVCKTIRKEKIRFSYFQI